MSVLFGRHLVSWLGCRLLTWGSWVTATKIAILSSIPVTVFRRFLFLPLAHLVSTISRMSSKCCNITYFLCECAVKFDKKWPSNNLVMVKSRPPSHNSQKTLQLLLESIFVKLNGFQNIQVSPSFWYTLYSDWKKYSLLLRNYQCHISFFYYLLN